MDFPKTVPSIGLVAGRFVDENTLTGTPGSLIPSAWGNAVTDEILAVITAAGLVPTENLNNQLLAAARKLAPGVTGSMRNARMSIPTAAGAPTFTADEIIVSTAVGGLNYKLSGFNKVINGGSTGVGGMDVGMSPVSGFVAIYAIYNPTAPLSATNPALLGVNATAAAQPEVYGGANMPAGYTASALVSVWPTTPGTAFAAGYQADRTVSFGGKSVLSGGTAVTATATSIASAVPRNAKTCAGYAINNAANGVIQIGGDVSYIGGGLVGVGNVSPATAPIWGWFATPIITPQTIYYAATQAASQNGVIWLSSYTF